MQSTLEDLAAPLEKEEQRILQARKEVAEKLEHIDSRLSKVQDALSVLLDRKQAKSRSTKRRPATPEEVQASIAEVTSNEASLTQAEIIKKVETRIKQMDCSCSGLKQRVKKLVGQSNGNAQVKQERQQHERTPAPAGSL